MIRKLLAVAGTAAVVAAAALGGTALADDGTASPSPSTSPSAPASYVSDPVRISHAQDDGTAGKVWANMEFDRTVTAERQDDDTYQVTMTDDGSFIPLHGAPSPREGVAIADTATKGTVHGTYAFTVTGADGTVTDAPYGPALDEKCDSPAGAARHCDNRVSNEEWVKAYFTGDDVQVTPGDWAWTYKTACETWVDNVRTQGKSAEDGDITGAKCDVPPPNEKPITDKLFSVQNVCRVKIDGPAGYVVQKANVWTITNRSGKAYKVHTAVEYGGKVTWFGWDNRGAVPAHSSLTVVSPYGGKLSVRVSGYGDLPASDDATGTSDHTVLCG